MQVITQGDLSDLIFEAQKSPRLRATKTLHQPEDRVQRMINAIMPGSYLAPHKHENPDKSELLCILSGKIAVLIFDEWGSISTLTMMALYGTSKIIDIPARTYHTIIALETSALLEVTEGPYNPQTHKKIAPWAPSEDNPKSLDYRMYLESIIHNWRGPV